MAKLYIKNTWQDEILSGAERYNILEDGGGAYKANMQIALVTGVVQAGSAVDAARMNNIEEGLDAVDTRAADMLTLLGVNPNGAYATLAARLAGLDTGWIADAAMWTYASATTFTVAGDVTARYSKGTKIKLTQTTEKYFYVVNASYNAPNTTVTITGGSDYSLANAAITSPNYSYASSPQGFPAWFNWSPAYGGFSVSPSQSVRFCIEGRTCRIETGPPSLAGTSNATDYTITAPVAAAAASPGAYFPIRFSNNGAVSATSGMGRLPGGSNVIQVFTSWSGVAWTASGTKYAVFCLAYEI